MAHNKGNAPFFLGTEAWLMEGFYGKRPRDEGEPVRSRHAQTGGSQRGQPAKGCIFRAQESPVNRKARRAKPGFIFRGKRGFY